MGWGNIHINGLSFLSHLCDTYIQKMVLYGNVLMISQVLVQGCSYHGIELGGEGFVGILLHKFPSCCSSSKIVGH